MCRENGIPWLALGTEHWVIHKFNQKWYLSLPARQRNLIYIMEHLRPIREDTDEEEVMDVSLRLATDVTLEASVTHSQRGFQTLRTDV